MQTLEAQLYRLKTACGAGTDTAFADFLGISQGSISGAKKKGQLPHSWFFQVAEKTNVSSDWLCFGRGSMRHSEEAKLPEKQTQITEEPRALASTKTTCERCVRLEKELEEERRERRELVAECRLAVVENRKLMKENGELKLEELKLSHRLDTAERMCRDYAAALKKTEATDPVFDEPQIIPSNSLLGR